MGNKFLKEAVQGAGTSYTENGAMSYATTGSEIVNQYGQLGTSRGRDISEVYNDQSKLWDEDSTYALRFPFYLRMITRKTKMFNDNSTDSVQKGQGSRDESFKRLLWIATCHPDVFYENLWVLPLVGSWKDLWVLMFMGRDFFTKEDREVFFQVICEGISDSYHKELVKKYLPRIRSNNKCKTDWARESNFLAKEFCKYIGWKEEDYRKFKSTGKAHEFQRIICKGLYSQLDFNKISGKALTNLISGNFLERHNLLQKYEDWIDSQPIVKFTGYVYELGQKLSHANSRNLRLIIKTVNKQFDGLIEQASKNNEGIVGNVWCALDTSGSMTCEIPNTNIKAIDVCKSLGIFFSTLNKGAFHKNVIMFDNISRVRSLSGNFSSMWNQIPDNAMGGTNFQSVIDEIIRIRRASPDIPLEDYPKTLLVVSDMQFNSCNNYYGAHYSESTNMEKSKEKLYNYFPKEWVDEFKFIWWYCTNRSTKDVPMTLDNKNSYMISGFDGSVISLLLGGNAIDNRADKPSPSMEELINISLNQEILQFLK